MATPIYKGHIGFGLASFFGPAAGRHRSQGDSFHLLHQCDNFRVRQVLSCELRACSVWKRKLYFCDH
jgi:hypothetical protein